MNRETERFELARGIYWVGSSEKQRGLGSNPYLFLDGEDALLLDPGSVLDFQIVKEKIEKILPVQKLTAIIIHHQDPDLCAALPLFEKAGFTGPIICHWRTMLIVQHYGITSPWYLVNEHGYRYTLRSGRELRFIPAAYLHFPGALMTWDRTSRVLFSGDLFGAFGEDEKLLAESATYIPAMKTFHEHYMPSNAILRSAMDRLDHLEIETIAPQHGCIITKQPREYINILRELHCGEMLEQERIPVHQVGGYTAMIRKIVERFSVIYPDTDWEELLPALKKPLTEDEAQQVWDSLFDVIYEAKGVGAISSIEPLVQQLVRKHTIKYPALFLSRFFDGEMEREAMREDNLRLRALLAQQEQQHRNTEKIIMVDPLTGLHNKRYFRFFIQADLERKGEENSATLFISLDRLPKINMEYGKEEGDNAIVTLSYLLDNIRKSDPSRESHHIFKLEGPNFVYYLPLGDPEAVLDLANEIRSRVEESDLFIVPLTVSVGLFFTEEVRGQGVDYLEKEGNARIAAARRRGGNSVYAPSAQGPSETGKPLVLIIDPDQYYVTMLGQDLEEQGYAVLTSRNGEEGLEKIEENHPDAIISELSLPMIDGIKLKSKLAGNPGLQRIPFFLVSHIKDDEKIRQAQKAGIRFYYQKPVSLVELTGIVEMELGGTEPNG